MSAPDYVFSEEKDDEYQEEKLKNVFCNIGDRCMPAHLPRQYLSYELT